MDTFLDSLTGRIFKILPLREEENPYLPAYLDTMRIELTGAYCTFPALQSNGSYIAIVNTVQYLADNDEDLHVLKREVFKMLRLAEQIRGCVHD